MGLLETIEIHTKNHESETAKITDRIIKSYVVDIYENFKTRLEVGKVYDVYDIDTIISEELDVNEGYFTDYAHEQLMEYYSEYSEQKKDVNFTGDYEVEFYDAIQTLFGRIEIHESYGTCLDEAVIKFKYEVQKIKALLQDEFDCEIKILSLEIAYPENYKM